jgi:molecular chaperone DnaK
VTLREVDTAATVAEMRPAQDGEFAGRVYVGPEQRPALVTWDPAGQFAVWDVATGDLLAKFAAGARPVRVRVDERSWRLVSELDRTVRAGRYRHGVAAVWDLATGEAVEEVVDPDPLRRYPSFAQRSARDGFAVEATAGEGVAARAVRVDADAAVCLRRDGRESLHGRLPAVDDMRVAFDADGRHLLAAWSTVDGAAVDVWRL